MKLVEEDEQIGKIEYKEKDRWGNESESEDEIYSPKKGLVLSIANKKKVKEGDILAEIECYEN